MWAEGLDRQTLFSKSQTLPMISQEISRLRGSEADFVLYAGGGVDAQLLDGMEKRRGYGNELNTHQVL